MAKMMAKLVAKMLQARSVAGYFGYMTSSTIESSLFTSSNTASLIRMRLNSRCWSGSVPRRRHVGSFGNPVHSFIHAPPRHGPPWPYRPWRRRRLFPLHQRWWHGGREKEQGWRRQYRRRRRRLVVARRRRRRQGRGRRRRRCGYRVWFWLQLPRCQEGRRHCRCGGGGP